MVLAWTRRCRHDRKEEARASGAQPGTVCRRRSRAVLGRGARRAHGPPGRPWPQHRLRGGRPAFAGPARDRVALRFIGRDGTRHDLTYADLARETSRFANVLRGLGVAPGELVCSLAGRIPELYVAALGTLKARSLFSPLFSAFGPEPIRTRLELGQARVLVTTEALYRRKVEALRAVAARTRARSARRRSGAETAVEGTHDLTGLLRAASDEFTIEADRPRRSGPHALHERHDRQAQGGPARARGRRRASRHGQARPRPASRRRLLVHGRPGLGHRHVVRHHRARSRTASRASSTRASSTAERWYETLRDEHVSVWYTAPTAIRMLMRAGDELARSYELPALRFCASVGEPLNPEAVVWGSEALGLPFHDNWWQTETGGIMIANFACMDIRPGLDGPAAAGHRGRDRAARPTRRADGDHGARRRGRAGPAAGLAVDVPRLPRRCRAHAQCFAGGWYLTRRPRPARRRRLLLVRRAGRRRDQEPGHLIGPFEVESALLEHPAVAEAGVIGKPDPIAGEVVKAFVALKPGCRAVDELERELLGFARTRLGAVVAPKEIEFVDHVPKTRSGKIMRRLLKARELGLEEGDTSTLEEGT